MNVRRRPILGALSGFFLGLFAGLDLLLLGAIPLRSNLLTVLPIVGLLVGILIGTTHPFRRATPTTGSAAPPPAEPPAPATTGEAAG